MVSLAFLGQNQLTDRGTTQKQHPVVFWALVLPRAFPQALNPIPVSTLPGWSGREPNPPVTMMRDHICFPSVDT